MKYIYILLCLAFVCCNNPPKRKQKRKITKNVRKQIVPKEINNNTIVRFLNEYGKNNPEIKVKITTKFGDLILKLYKDTPLHRANFIYLTKTKYFDNTFFHRVVKDFMIQGGNSDDWQTASKRNKLNNYTIPAEFRKNRIHKKGALASSRSYTNNPQKKSNPFEFYIVKGIKYSAKELDILCKKYDRKLSTTNKNIYLENGGCPHLDNEHTVFGELIKGFDTLDKINSIKIDEGEWPLENIVMKVSVY